MFDIGKYGATGSRDDTNAIQNAITAAGAVRGTVFVPVGTFSTSGLSASSPVAFSGPGTLKLVGGATIISVTTSGVTFDGLTFDQQNTTDSVAIEFNGATNCAVKNCTFNNTKAAAVNIKGASSDLLIRNNFFGSGGYGVLTNSAATCARVAVIGNVFNGGSTGDAIEFNTPTGGATDIVVVGNTISGYTSSGPNDGIGIGCAHAIYGLIADNLIYNCGLDGIHLEDGTAELTITGNTIRGCGRSGISINSGNASRPTSHISVTGNTVIGCISTAGTGAIAVEGNQNSSGHTIVGNVVRGNGRAAATCYGIQVAPLAVSNCAVSGNIVSNTVGSTTAGIQLNNATDCVVTGNRCFDDQGSPTQNDGLLVQGTSSNNVVMSNDLRGNVNTSAVAQTLLDTLSVTARKASAGDIATFNPNGGVAGSWGISVAGAGASNDVYLKLSDVVLAGSTVTGVLKFLSGVGGSEWGRITSSGQEIPIRRKAGAPVDGDFANPTDGLLALDTTNHRLYVRDGGAWKFAALT